MGIKKSFFFATHILFWIFAFLFLGHCSASDKPTIAVLRFENKSTFDRLDPFEIALPYMLISDLSKISGIQLVERDKIDKLMAETGLAGKDLMDPAAMQRVGNALGADIIIIGDFCEEIESGQLAEESSLSIRLNFKDVSTGKIIKNIRAEGKSKEFYRLEKELVRLLAEALKCTPTIEEADSIRKVATRLLEAAIHFAKGKELQYRAANYYGEKKYGRGDQEKLLLEAIKEFETALYLDPQYADAGYELFSTARADIVDMFNDERVIVEGEKFVNCFPDDRRCVEILMSLGAMCLHRDINKSISMFKKRIQNYAEFQEAGQYAIENAYWRLALSYRKTGDYIKAIKTYKSLREKFPEEMIQCDGLDIPVKIYAPYRLLDCYRKAGMYEEALNQLDEMLEKRLFFAGNVQKFMSDVGSPTAKEIFDDLIVIKKIRGDIYAEMGEYQKAIDEWQGLSKDLPEGKFLVYGLKSNFNERGFWNDFARAYEKAGGFFNAIKCYQNIVYAYKDVPNSYELIEAYYNIARGYQAMESWEDALGTYKKCQLLGEGLFKKGYYSNKIIKNIKLCRQKLEIKSDGSLAPWQVDPVFQKIAREKKIDKDTVLYTNEQIASTALKKEDNSLWIALRRETWSRLHRRKPRWRGDKKYSIESVLCKLNTDSARKDFIKIPNRFSSVEIVDIAISKDNIWAACGTRGLLRYNKKLKEWTQYTTKNGLVHNTVWAVVATPEGIYFGFGDEGRGGIGYYNKEDESWYVYFDKKASRCGISALALDENVLWTGTMRGTISTFDMGEKRWVVLRELNGKRIDPVVQKIVSHNNHVWFACHYLGIIRYDKDTGRWQDYNWRDWGGPDPSSLAASGYEHIALAIAIDKNVIWSGFGSGCVRKYDLLTDKWQEVIDLGPGLTSIVATDDAVWFTQRGGSQGMYGINGVMKYIKKDTKQ